MADSKSVKTVVKKVSPYPINIEMGHERGQIQKLTDKGFIVETPKPLKVGDEFQVQFYIPAGGPSISAHCVVVKTYDYVFKDKKDLLIKKKKLSEVHFKSIHQERVFEIKKFLNKIGQVG